LFNYRPEEPGTTAGGGAYILVAKKYRYQYQTGSGK